MNNYGELVAAIQGYLYDRTDLAGMIPTWIALSERRIFRLLRCPANEVLYSETLPAESSQWRIPADFLEAKILSLDGRQLLRISDQEYLRRQYSYSGVGYPAMFCRIGDYLNIWPVSDEDKELQIVYYQDYSGQMTLDSHTTEILRIAPDLYLYGALMEAMPYLGQAERLTEFNSLFDQAIAQINSQADEAEYAGSTVDVASVYGDTGVY